MQKKFFFLRLPSGVTNFNTSIHALLFENFSLQTLNSEQEPSVKKTDQPGRLETGQPAS